MNYKRILITGANGKVANSIIELLAKETDNELHLLSSKPISLSPAIQNLSELTTHQVDTTDHTALKKLCMKVMPNVIINTVALTNVDECETNKQLAQALNVRYVEHLTRIARITDSHLLQLSTDYVFNGEKGPYAEQDTPSPINYYGKTKLSAENVCISSHINCAILRTNVVYGLGGKNKQDFVTWIKQSAETNKQVNIVNDQYGNPTLADDIALAIMQIIKKERTGIYNVAGAEYLSRLQFAQEILSYYGLPQTIINPITTQSLQQVAARPLRAGLITLKAETDLGIKPATILSGLKTIDHKNKTEKE